MERESLVHRVLRRLIGPPSLELAISTIGLWNSTKNLHEETRRLATLAEAQSKDLKACIAFAADRERKLVTVPAA